MESGNRTEIKQRFLVNDVVNIPWDDVVCEDQLRDRIEENVISVLKYKGKESPFGILLYGLPGSGKSHLISAALRVIPCVTIFKLSIYDLFSNQFQERKGVLSELINLAVDQEPCAILIDDVEVLCRNNFPNECSNEHRQSLRTELLRTLKDTPKAAVQMILCSTRPSYLDEEFLKSVHVKIFIPLPSEKMRKHILAQQLSGIPDIVSDGGIHRLAAKTINYSPSDLICLIKDAQMIPVRSIGKATHFKLLNSGKYVACDSTDPQATEMKFSDITDTDLIELPSYSEDDLITALENSQPSFTTAEIIEFEQLKMGLTL